MARFSLSAAVAAPISRSEYFGLFLCLACINGLGSRVIENVRSVGWTTGILSTFEVSAIVWLACLGGIALILKERTGQVRRADLALTLGSLALVALPVGGLSWFAIALLSLYLISSSEPLSAMRRGAVILLAVTVPMLWSRLLFQYFAKLILDIDASLVSLLLGSPRVGNVVRFADDSGSLLILPYCSSLHNVSLTILTWVFLGEWLEHRPSQRDLRWCVLAALSVIAVNVTRMSLMGLSDAHYRAIHSLTGDMIVNVLTLTLMVGFCLTGMRRESVSGR